MNKKRIVPVYREETVEHFIKGFDPISLEYEGVKLLTAPFAFGSKVSLMEVSLNSELLSKGAQGYTDYVDSEDVAIDHLFLSVIINGKKEWLMLEINPDSCVVTNSLITNQIQVKLDTMLNGPVQLSKLPTPLFLRGKVDLEVDVNMDTAVMTSTIYSQVLGVGSVDGRGIMHAAKVEGFTLRINRIIQEDPFR